jgi:hypothetical protein
MLMSLPMGTGTCREKEKTMAASLAEASWWTGAIKTERSYIRPMSPEVKGLLRDANCDNKETSPGSL